jgi:hypothetical protein
VNEGSNNYQNSGARRVARRTRMTKAARRVRPGNPEPGGHHPSLSQSTASLRRKLEQNIKALNEVTSPTRKNILKRRVKIARFQLRLTPRARNRSPVATPIIHPPLAPENTPRTFINAPPSGRLSGVQRATPRYHARRSRRLFSHNASPPPEGERLPSGRNSNSNRSNFSVGSRGSKN